MTERRSAMPPDEQLADFTIGHYRSIEDNHASNVRQDESITWLKKAVEAIKDSTTEDKRRTDAFIMESRTLMKDSADNAKGIKELLEQATSRLDALDRRDQSIVSNIKTALKVIAYIGVAVWGALKLLAPLIYSTWTGKKSG